MPRIVLALLLAGVFSCHAQEKVGGDPAMSEEDRAKNNVWHKAKLRGVSFRAIGQEPAWLLEIKNGSEILLKTNYGENSTAYPWVEPRVDQSARSTLFEVDVDTSVLIEGKPCTDSMSGEAFQTTVTVRTGMQTLKGCGRALH